MRPRRTGRCWKEANPKKEDKEGRKRRFQKAVNTVGDKRKLMGGAYFKDIDRKEPSEATFTLRLQG